MSSGATQNGAGSGEAGEYAHLKKIVDEEVASVMVKRKTLRELDLFVMDNSLRESTVGQVRGHTLQDKWDVLKEVKKCGFKNIVVAAFSHRRRVDDKFVEQLSKTETDMSNFYAFSEIGEGPGKKELPVGLIKMKKYGLQNPLIEIDLEKCSATQCEELCALLKERFDYTYKELSPNAKIFVNLRDFPFAMACHPENVYRVVKFLANLPANERPMGLLFEEPTGRYLPEIMGAWTKVIRILMTDHNWNGRLLAHVHEKWSFAECVQLECLSNGADGIWSSICEEGAALGHACSTVSIMNLVRLGNLTVRKRYNCQQLREAAINVTKITTGHPPHPKKVIYGSRALDIAFGFGGIAGGQIGAHEFDVARFFGIDPPLRINTLANGKLVKERLVQLFGEDEQFTEEIGDKMLQVIKDDLTNNHKEEYMSHIGLAILFDRAGGHQTAKMVEKITKIDQKMSDQHKELIKEVREIWDEWDLREVEQNDDCLEFYSFYNGFMAPYFGCYECDDSKKGLQALDMDKDGKIDWNEFCIFLKWALREYPAIQTMEELVDTAFTRGLIPAMSDEIIKKNQT